MRREDNAGNSFLVSIGVLNAIVIRGVAFSTASWHGFQIIPLEANEIVKTVTGKITHEVCQ